MTDSSHHPGDFELWRRCRGGGTDSGPCPDLETVAALLDGRLPTDEQDAVEGHLAGCDRCLDLILEARDLMAERRHRLPLLPAGVASRARGLVPGDRARRLVPWGWSAAAAAAILVSLAGYVAGSAAGPERTIEQPVIVMADQAWSEDLLGVDPLDDSLFEASFVLGDLLGDPQP